MNYYADRDGDPDYQAHEVETRQTKHAFRQDLADLENSSDERKCLVCGKPLTDSVHE